MKILAFDTSTEYCSVALYLDGKIRKTETLARHLHSELLLPMIREILDEGGLELADIDGLAFGAGPGSFTGLRIACGVAQGLAFAASLPVIGISTLEAIAQQNTHDKIIVAMDARMGEIYHAAYTRQENNLRTISEPMLCQPQHAPALPGSQWIGCGSGFDIYDRVLSECYNQKLVKINYECYPHAQEIAQLAAAKAISNFHTDPVQAAPVYLRNKVALKESERGK
ncbi:tRNA (adenosine(37)-N6)-threonylcarbamoyltransferase complex dimerization subunit type 1 TsaB [Nitrosomonas sp.]|uniref:tRNA (adenosine(37)-N6)-threonylcarbamoyltransferase complex dimerization subunit type 1 TsaB n=1 Tax=Nitrosomonas sp. TaxID=42353 RepID=UPI002088167D|nr:tRNA (adenosine(37)-N6)-threonylcarbamoyltransferase complex dimerization subunit type 1 TsaB [Nitrosomonas sp.]GJL75102.1 MAG: tRNA (adenosine(37)-N6)-threonylcarbamoyltransferase complex dimerization subunit type 1 TsaB [Nitrosomonas sp.]